MDRGGLRPYISPYHMISSDTVSLDPLTRGTYPS